MKQCMILLLLLSCTFAFGQAKKPTSADPWAGNYKLDTARSQFEAPPPKEETLTIEAANQDSVKYTIKGTDAQGKAYTVTYDGKPGTPSPIMVDGKEDMQITYQMPSSHEFTSVTRASQGGSGSDTITLSNDSKTITVRAHAKDAKGTEHQQTIVYTRE